MEIENLINQPNTEKIIILDAIREAVRNGARRTDRTSSEYRNRDKGARQKNDFRR